MKRKILATILALCLVLSAFPGSVFAAASDYPALQPDTTTEVYIDTAGQIVYYRFTPDHSCVYAFHSVSEEDTYGELYTESGTLLYENDDFYGLNFGISCTLQAGETYILAVSLLDTAMTGWFELITQTNHDDIVEVVQPSSCKDSGIWNHTCSICNYQWTENVPPTHVYEDGVCSLCGSIMTQNGVCGEGLIWRYDGARKTVTISGTGAMCDYEEITPPWQTDEFPVHHLIVENGVTYIGKNAFASCDLLESVDLSETVTGIGDNAFSYCANLKVLEIPEGLATIGVLAFSYCDQLREVTIPSTVTELGFGAFQGCRRLERIRVDGNSGTYSSDEYGVLFDVEKTVLIQAPAALAGAYEIPDSVSTIYDASFSGCNRLAAVRIPEGVTEIGSGAFTGCGQLTFLCIPGTVTNMGEGAVSSCEKLKAILFEGNAPTAEGSAIEDVGAVAYYPGGNQTWTDTQKAALGEKMVWLPISGMAILAQPEAWDALPGEMVTLSVGAAGDGLSYTWYAADPGSDAFTPVNAAGNVFQIEFTESAAGRQIYCVVTDANGASAKTDIVTLTAMGVLENDIPVPVLPESAGQFKYFAYTPADSCYYTFRSYGTLDTYCELYESQYILLDSNDDGEDVNFALRVFLEADTTYILGVRTHDDESGQMEVTVESGHEFVRATYLPTCTQNGYTLYSCTVCGMSYTTNEVPATGHDYQSVNIDANCTEDGYTRHTCTTCGHSYKDNIVAASGHVWQAATCSTAKTCSVCGCVEGNPLGHIYESVVIAPECLKDGYTAHICSGCGHRYYDNYVTATGHNWQAANCQEPQTCSECGATSGRPADHDYQIQVTAPGCHTQGYTTHTCRICGDSYVDAYVSAVGHNWLAASCTEAMRCVNCGETVGEPLGHYFVEGVCVDCGEADPAYGGLNITLQYPTLLLEDEIRMNVYFTLDREIELDKIGMLTWSCAPDKVDISTAESVIPGGTYDAQKGYYGVVTNGIPAQNLGDAIYFCIYAELSDGSYAYSKQVSYSPANYAYNRLSGDAEPAAKALYVAILNYGAAAQTYLNYRTDALVNARLTSAQKALVDDFRGDMVHNVAKPADSKQGRLVANGGFSAKKPTISLDSAFSINYYFTPNAPVVGDLTFYYWNAEDYEAVNVLTLRNATGSMIMSESDGVYSAVLDGIAAKDIDGALYVCGVYTATDGTTYSTGILPYSIGVFCSSQIDNNPEVRPLAAAIAVYGYYASCYFSE